MLISIFDHSISIDGKKKLQKALTKSILFFAARACDVTRSSGTGFNKNIYSYSSKNRAATYLHYTCILRFVLSNARSWFKIKSKVSENKWNILLISISVSQLDPSTSAQECANFCRIRNFWKLHAHDCRHSRVFANPKEFLNA